MSFVNSLIQTYEILEKSASDEIAPLYHKVMKANIQITLDSSGNAIDVRKLEKGEEETIVPATTESKTRTSSKIAPYPLSEQIRYLADCGNSNCKTAYLEQLHAWAASETSHPFLNIIYNYVKSGKIENDIKEWLEPENKKESYNIKSYEKKVVRWVVLDGDDCPETWKNKALIKAWIDYCGVQMASKANEQILSILDGSPGLYIKYHDKPINTHANGKLISKNDKAGLTYVGRFKKDDIILPITEESSFKLHQALSWIVNKHGMIITSRNENPVYTCIWVISKPDVTIDPIKSLLSFDTKASGQTVEPMKRYAIKELYSGQYNIPIKEGDNARVIVATIGGVTKGRLSLEDYSESTANQLIENFTTWDYGCQWIRGFGDSRWIWTPTMYDIINVSAGTVKEQKGESPKYIVSDAKFAMLMRDLTRAKIYGTKIPLSVVNPIIGKSNNWVAYQPKSRQKLENVTYAVLRKYYLDYYRREYSFMLDANNTERSYLFGRLLAIYRKAEYDTLSKDSKRATSAERLQGMFAKRPLSILQKLDERYNTIWKRQLYKKKGAAVRYDKLIGELTDMLYGKYSMAELKKPLEPSYLFGAHAQYDDLFKKKVTDTDIDTDK